ncbi:putative ribosomal protein S27 [Helianthus annuus]|nr:putative ribosomal protein S27 [Helianthus annuus]
MVLPNDVDLLNPPAELEKRKHKLKRLVQSPNSFFMVLFIRFSI